jgi:hypothetical protein
MVKSNSRTQQPKSRGRRRTNNAQAAPGVYAPATSSTELKSYYEQNGNFQLYHNTPALYFNLSNMLNQITTGTGFNNRIGTKIHVKTLDVLMVFNNKFDRTNVCYRVVLFAAPSTTSTDSASELIHGGQFSGLPVIQNAVLLHDAAFPLNQGSSQSAGVQKERSHSHRASIAINRAVVYNTDGNCATRIIGFVCAYDAFGTLTTDNIASVAQTSWRVTYTDE